MQFHHRHTCSRVAPLYKYSTCTDYYCRHTDMTCKNKAASRRDTSLKILIRRTMASIFLRNEMQHIHTAQRLRAVILLMAHPIRYIPWAHGLDGPMLPDHTNTVHTLFIIKPAFLCHMLFLCTVNLMLSGTQFRALPFGSILLPLKCLKLSYSHKSTTSQGGYFCTDSDSLVHVPTFNR